MIKMKSIYWERVNIHILLEGKIEKYHAYLIKKDKVLLLSIHDNEIVINVTNTPEGEMLDSGKWNLVITEKKLDSPDCRGKIDYNNFQNRLLIDNSIYEKINDCSRIFKYRNGTYAYLVDFFIDENLCFYVCTDFMVHNPKWKRFFRFSETNKISGKIIILCKQLFLIMMDAFYWIVRLFKWNGKKNFLFLTESSNELMGNLKYLYDSIDSKDCHKYVYSMDKFDPSENKLWKKCLSYLKETFFIARSDVIFLDNYTQKLTHLHVSKKCRIVQLWHAGVGFKAVGYARFGLDGSPHPYWSCHRQYTDIIVDEDSLVDIYKEVFGAKTECFKSLGLPRLDAYLNEDRIQAVCSKLFSEHEQLKNKKIILFAPTYRGNGTTEAYYDYSSLDLKAIHNYCAKNNFVFIVKMHPFIKKKINIPSEYTDVILDYSYHDINDLIYISDIMITDYSSCAYEFSLFNRPLIFFRYDKKLYEYLRPMHTLNTFTDEQYEVETCQELLDILEKKKDILIGDRFKKIEHRESKYSCEKIKNMFL